MATDLKKIYLFSHSDKFSFSHIDSLVRSVSSELFLLLMPPGIFPDDLDENLPILNYGNTPELQKLLDDGTVLAKNVYNLPKYLKNANSKVEFHKRMKDHRFVPKTVFTKEAAMGLKFPVIAKPADGSKGEGIEVFKTKEELKASNEKFDVFSEKFDLVREFRVISLNGKVVYVAERKPDNDKAKHLREGQDIFDRSGTLANRSSYRWKTITFTKNGGPKDLPELKAFASLCAATNQSLNLEFLGIDIGLDSAGKLFVIEANTCPGLNRDQIVLLYNAVFEDFYGRPVDKETKKKLKFLSKELKRANKDNAKFSFSPHQGNRFYHYDDKVDLMTGEHKGKQILSTKYNIEKSMGDSLKNIKKKYESKIMGFEAFVLNEKARVTEVGDTTSDIIKLELMDVLNGKSKPKLVEPHEKNNGLSWNFNSIDEPESGSRDEEATITLSDGTPVFVEFNWSWSYKPGMKGDGYIQPDDPDEYTIDGFDVTSLYFGENEVEVDDELAKGLENYFKDFLPAEK